MVEATHIQQSQAAAREPKSQRLGSLVRAGALFAGVIFRLFFPGAIEFQGDERFSFDHVIGVLHGAAWPPLGMPMSIGGPNPGMSVWIFILLGLLAGPSTPVGLAECVQVLNIMALAGFLVFIFRAVPSEQREPWLWGAALWAVNPLAIVYERKIWPPSTLPAFSVAMIAGWWYRRSWAGSFVFAGVTVLGGQIHPTCAFFGLSLFVWTLAEDRRSFRYGGLVAGALAGFLPAVNWVLAYYSAGNSLHKLRSPELDFYARWLTTPFGYGSDHTLGPVEFSRFLGWPEIADRPTYITLAVYLAILAIALALILPAAVRLLQSGPPFLHWLFFGASPAGQIVRAAFFGLGTILTVLTIRGGGLYPHYMIVIAPIMGLWVALLASFSDGGALLGRGRAVLTALCVLDAAVVVLLFSYIHSVGDIHGEFGPSWEWQQQLAR